MRTRNELIYEANQLHLLPENELDSLSTKELVALFRSYTQPIDALEQYPVWLAKNVHNLREDQFRKLLKNPAYAYEPKYDGCRAKLHITVDGHVRIDSRNQSVQTYEYVEKSANFPWLSIPQLLMPYRDSVFDTEIMAPRLLYLASGKSWVSAASRIYNADAPESLRLQEWYGRPTFYIHDCLRWGGNDIRHDPLHLRKPLVSKFCAAVRGFLPFVEVPCTRLNTLLTGLDDAVDMFNWCITTLGDQGIEGMMFKDIEAPYPTVHGSRTATMYKWKTQREIDCFIVGSTPGQGDFEGMIGALDVAVYNGMGGEIVRIGAIQPGSMIRRQEMSYPDGSLKEEYLNRVITCTFQEWTRNQYMRHAIGERWRPDKTAQECLLENEVPYVLYPR